MKRILVATALSLAIASSFTWADVKSNVENSVVSKMKSSTAQEAKELTDVANQGFEAMRNIQYARLAIFSGNTKLATELTTQAATLLNSDNVEWSKFVKQVNDPELAKNDQFVIIDATIAVGENYVATPEKQAAIDKANVKLKSGDQKGALQELRLANIAVNETQYLMPLNVTRQAVKDALKLLESGKYYEANIVLRDAEQAVAVVSVTLIDGN